MARKLAISASIAISVNLLFVPAVQAQDFMDVQIMTGRVLFAAEDVAAQKRVAEIRRIEALDQRAKAQDALLQEQAVTMQKLGGELQALRDERQVIELGAAFDAAIAARQWSAARSLLADAVTVDLVGGSDAAGTIVAADTFISGLSNSSARRGVLPRSGQQVRFETDHAILTSHGSPWDLPPRPRNSNEAGGQYEYRFLRTASGWKIDGLVFRPDA